MAIAAGNVVKFVKVATLQKYNDITTKDAATVYFVDGDNSIFVDGTRYGMNQSDKDLFIKKAGDGVTGELDFQTTGYLKNLPQINNTDTNLSVSSEYGITLTSKEIMSLWSEALMLNSNNGRIKLQGAGGSATATIFNVADPINNDEVANKKYVDAGIKTHVTDKLGKAQGIATLDASGTVLTSQLPSYVDDVEEYAASANFPTTGESGKLYVDKATNKVYRWSGTGYVEISASLAIGVTSSTAFRGDYGQTAYTHTSLKNNPHGVTKAQVGLGSVGNFGTANQAEAEEGTLMNKYMTPATTKAAIAALSTKTVWSVVS